ncbi:MAG: sulfotransferase [Candidatus Limnocylindria bacterium]
MPTEFPVGDNRPFPLLRHRLRGTALHRSYRFLQSRRGARAERQLLASIETYCLFLGHARSGHSILGALLDAHPQMAISDELDATAYIHAGFARDQVLWLSIKVARDQAARFRRKRGRGGKIYSYHVPDQWQGRATSLRVVGDSNAGGTVRALAEDPGLLLRLEATMAGLHLRFVHVARNPFDNIGTMMLRSGRSFESASERYFENWRLIDALADRIGRDRIHTVRHEALVSEPREAIGAICGFLGVQPSDAYLDACAAVLFDSPARSRHQVEWSAAQRARIEAGIAEVEGLRGYSFKS